MLPLKIEEVDINYLQALPESGLRETSTLEFKREIDRTDRMLKEVCAFANTYSGDLVIGVEAEDGVPTAVPGVDPKELSLDQYELKLMQQIRSGIEPAVPFQIKSHALETGNFVTQIRVGQSFIGPHRLVRSHIFYERASTASVEMSMEKLREAFGVVAQLQERAEAHHKQRMENHKVVGMHEDRAVAFVHVVPVLSLRGQVQLPVATFPPEQTVLPPSRMYDVPRIDHLGHSLILKIDRGINYSHTGRNGMVEGAMELLPEQGPEFQGKIVWSMYHDKLLVEFVQGAFEFLIQNEISGPAFLMVSIWKARGMKGYRTEMGSGLIHGFPDTWLKCDTEFVESFEQPAHEVMQRPLNIIWNGLGSQRCSSYDGDDNWVPVR